MSIELWIADDLFDRLQEHLFQPDGDEHAAVVLAGIHHSERRTRLLARELHVVPAEDFPPGRYGYRQTAARFVAEFGSRAGEQGLAYVALHSHPGAERVVGLSGDDLASHRRLYPHLLDLTGGVPVAGVALGRASAAGEVWMRGSTPVPLDALQIVGPHLNRLTDRPWPASSGTDPRFDRQARLFGASGQGILRAMHVGVIGAGGGGSMLVEQLAHLGVGRLTVVDYDVVKDVNLSRIVGATVRDSEVATKKVDVMERLVHQIDESIEFDGIDGDIADLPIAERLLDCDFLFLATDTITSRLVFNAIVHQYLIPGIQIGAKIEVAADGSVSQVYVAVRPVLPSRGCFQCNSLIDPMRLQEEARTEEERVAQNYLDEAEVVDPSVVSLNGITASHAVNTMLFSVMGFAEPELLSHRLFFPRTGEVLSVLAQKDSECRFCSQLEGAVYGLGDPTSRLPCRRVMSDDAEAGARANRLFGRLPRWARTGLNRALRKAAL
jgi:molybdopterin/thiamine biosynthesis adenylyltransferase